ncbi:hypothetical protein KBD71_00655 [Candidatus Woesebacteria bacterium]|nr:hypothetical protein [Candidatus Woesebacteria bacterium]
MTTRYLEQHLPELLHSSLDIRASKVEEEWPPIRHVTDEILRIELIGAFQLLAETLDLKKSRERANTILHQLYRSGNVIPGFNIAAQFLASATNRELATIAHIPHDEIDAIDLALRNNRE